MNHPKFNLWSDSRSDFTPTPDPLPAYATIHRVNRQAGSPKLGEGRKTGNGVLRVLRTRKIPFPELIPPFPPREGGRGGGVGV
jgi:hypothetical protein